MKNDSVCTARSTSIKATFDPANPAVLCGGIKDTEAAWRCTVVHRDTGKKLTPSRVAVVDFPPASSRLLVYSVPSSHEILDGGIAGWKFRFRGDQMHEGDPPATHTLKLKVWVANVGWNYSDDAWSFQERVVSGEGGVESSPPPPISGKRGTR